MPVARHVCGAPAATGGTAILTHATRARGQRGRAAPVGPAPIRSVGPSDRGTAIDPGAAGRPSAGLRSVIDARAAPDPDGGRQSSSSSTVASGLVRPPGSSPAAASSSATTRNTTPAG